MIDETRKGFHIDKRRSYLAAEGAEWEAGAWLVRSLNADGKVQVSVATGASGEVICGMARHDRISAVTTVAVERITFVDGGGNPENTKQLRGTSVVADSELVTNPTTGAAYTRNDDYTLSVGGSLVRVAAGSGGTIPESGSVDIMYRRNILKRESENRLGVDYNRSHGDSEELATVCQGNSQVFTDQFDSSQAYAVDDPLYVTDDGTGRSTTVDNGGQVVGRVATPPSVDEPLLEIEFATPSPVVI